MTCSFVLTVNIHVQSCHSRYSFMSKVCCIQRHIYLILNTKAESIVNSTNNTAGNDRRAKCSRATGSILVTKGSILSTVIQPHDQYQTVYSSIPTKRQIKTLLLRWKHPNIIVVHGTILIVNGLNHNQDHSPCRDDIRNHRRCHNNYWWSTGAGPALSGPAQSVSCSSCEASSSSCGRPHRMPAENGTSSSCGSRHHDHDRHIRRRARD